MDTQTILTIHGSVITKNHRIKVTQTDQRTWQLHIRDVRETDRGYYMCQLNTDPMKSQQGYLEVVGKQASRAESTPSPSLPPQRGGAIHRARRGV